jgi:hypothetical protein
VVESWIGDEQKNCDVGGTMTRTEEEKMLAGELYKTHPNSKRRLQ